MKACLCAGALCAVIASPVFAQMDAGTPPSSPATSQNAPIPLKLLLPTPDQNGTVLVNRASYRPGQPVAMTFVISNATKKPVVYNFPTGQKFDITINDPKGALVWTWSRGHLFTQSVSRLSLAPGKQETFKAVWNGRTPTGQSVSPGLYTINARMTSTTGTAITGGVVVNNDPDPMNVGVSTHSPAESGAMRQVDVTPPISASKTVAIGVPPPSVK